MQGGNTMDWKYLFTSFEGRIGRQQWWMGAIAIFFLSLILSFVVMPMIGMSMMPGFDPVAGPDAMESMLRKMAIGQIILTAIIAYPATAVMKKRLNDRDRPGWYVYLFWTPTVLSLLLGITGLSLTMTDMSGVMVPGQSTLGWIVSIFSIVIGLWALVELGILKGTDGPNQHGKDPVPA